ncbi:Succinate-semialdehyde dehydrogenase, mitochondrial, partial [Orchesella cincta]
MYKLAVTLNVATPLAFFGRAKLKTQFLQLSKHVGILSQSRMLHDKAFINAENGFTQSLEKRLQLPTPATQEVIATVPDMNHEDTELAIQAAKQAFNSWKNTTGKERAKLMRKWYDLAVAKQDELAKVLTLENGKPLKESVGEIIYSTDYLEFYAEEARRIHGVEFPTAMIARKAAAAIASGCTCVIKPAEDTPLSALLLAEVANEAGIPPGVINVVTASRENTPSVGEKLCSSEQIAGISFTGSTAVGKILYKQCSSTIKRRDGSKFRNTGQTCVSTNRILVHEKVHDKFVEKLKSSMASLVSALVQDALSKGAKKIVGGEPHQPRRTYYEPTLLTGINPTMQAL